MRTQRGYRALDNPAQPQAQFPDAGMHNKYDTDGNARYCPCSEFWANNPDPDYYVAHEDIDPTARISLDQIVYMKARTS